MAYGPSKLTPQVWKDTVEAAEKGVTWEALAAVAGVTSRTILLWRRKGEAAKSGKLHDWVSDITDAQTRARKKIEAALFLGLTAPSVTIKTHVKELKDGTTVTEVWKETKPPDMRNLFEWLWRKFPEQWRRIQTLEAEIDANVTAGTLSITPVVDGVVVPEGSDAPSDVDS